MKIFILNLISFVIVIFIISCSESGTGGPTTEVNYFPYSVGSYRISDNYRLDLYYNRKKDTSYYEDSVVVVGMEIKGGKMTYKVEKFVEDTLNETHYFYSDTKKLYADPEYILADSADMGFEIPFKFGDELWLIADMGQYEWLIYDDNVSFIVEGVTVSGKFIIKCKKGNTKNITVNGKIIRSQEFIMQHIFDGNMIGPFNPDFTFTSHFYYGENVNLLQYILEPQTVGIPPFYSMDVGFESIVKRFVVAE